ncbi:hypothetical protein HYZ80_02075 [Candidatus Parcubacteria bacterium]|nr:hypothetical protein [Candidatus Parcubacteria bacterium]
MAPSGSATQEFIPTHRLAPEFLGGLTRDLIPHAKTLSKAVNGRGLMVLGVNRHHPGMLSMRLECGTKVSVPEHAVIFAPTHWINEALLRKLPENLQLDYGLIRRGASQGVVLARSIGGNGQARSRVRFATGDELEVPAWAVTEERPGKMVLPAANGKRRPPYVNRHGRFNGSRGR